MIRQKFKPFLIIFIIGFALYGLTLFFGFSYFDDNALILDNYPLISRVQNIGQIFTSDVFFSANGKFYYRPLLNVSFMVDALTNGSLPVMFHLTNILLHIIAASLVFLLLAKLNCRRALAYFLALFFLVQPVLTQAVAWIPGRNDSLLAIFVLAAFLCFLAFQDRPRLGYYLGYLGFFVLALFTKETAIFLPFLVIFYFLLVEPDKVTRRDRGLIIFGSAALIFVWYLARHLALGVNGFSWSAALASLAGNSSALLVFLGKSFLPFNLSVLPVLRDAQFIYGLIVLPLLALAWLFSRRKNKSYLVFGLVWFLLFLLPSFVRPNLTGTPDFLEHRLYLPLIGLFIALAEIDWLKKLDFKRWAVRIGAGLLLLFFAILAFRHSLHFKDQLTFWRAAVAASPHSPLAHRNLGAMEYLGNESAKAADEYRAALALNPEEPMAHNNLGVIYLAAKNYAAAEREFKKELAVNPGYDKALLNLGDLYYVTGRASEAVSYWQTLLQIYPNSPEAASRLNNLRKPLR